MNSFIKSLKSKGVRVIDWKKDIIKGTKKTKPVPRDNEEDEPYDRIKEGREETIRMMKEKIAFGRREDEKKKNSSNRYYD